MQNEQQNQKPEGAPQAQPLEQPRAHYAPPPPAACNGSNIFDCLTSGSLLLMFCLMSWTHGANAFGRYAFFRGGTISGAILFMVTLFSAGAVAAGVFLLYVRIRHWRYCKIHFPKPKKPKGDSVFADMKDALDQLLGLKAYQGLDKEAARAAVAKKRRLADWLRHEKTRIGASSLMLFILMYLTPGFIIYIMGQHVLMYFLVEFMMVMTTFVMFLIAWVDLGE